MMVRSEKHEGQGQGSCEACAGHGSLAVFDLYTNCRVMDSTCRKCCGTGTIDAEILERHALAAEIRSLLDKHNLTVREASKKLQIDVREVIRARQCEVPAASIRVILAWLRGRLEGGQHTE